MTRVRRMLVAAHLFVIFHLSDMTLRALGFDRTIRLFLGSGQATTGTNPGANSRGAPMTPFIWRVAQMIRRYDVRSRLDCLPRAIAIYHVLVHYGVAVDFIIGVRTFPFAGHAWIEHEGKVVSDFGPEHRAYTSVMRLSNSRESRPTVGGSGLECDRRPA